MVKETRSPVTGVEAAQKAGVRRFVYVSGVGAASESAKHWFRFKWQAEQHLAQSGLEWVVVRPTWVYGPADNSLNRILRFVRFMPVLPTFGNGKQAMQPVFIDDVGRVLADAALRPEAANQLFELGGPEVMTMDAVLKAAFAAMGKKRPILHQPVFVGKAIGRLAGILPSPPLSADAIDFITAPAVADNVRLLETLGREIERWYYVDMRRALDPNADREDAVISLPADRQIKRFGAMSSRTTRPPAKSTRRDSSRSPGHSTRARGGWTSSGSGSTTAARSSCGTTLRRRSSSGSSSTRYR